MKKYIKRLLQEWITHKKIIISVDYDDTISHYRLNNEKDVFKTITLLKLAKKFGCYIVVFTACSEDKFESITNYCKALGIKIDSINKNPIELPYGNNGKIYYNINLCDRSGLRESLKILKKTIKKYKKHIKNDSK